MYLPIPYQDPIDHGPLIEESAGFRNPRNGALYALREGMPVFLSPDAVERDKKGRQKGTKTKRDRRIFHSRPS